MFLLMFLLIGDGLIVKSIELNDQQCSKINLYSTSQKSVFVNFVF